MNITSMVLAVALCAAIFVGCRQPRSRAWSTSSPNSPAGLSICDSVSITNWLPTAASELGRFVLDAIEKVVRH